jgi:hypothetical protein
MLRQNDKIVLFFYEMRKPLEYGLESTPSRQYLG